MTTLRIIIVLKRDPADATTVQSLNPDIALRLFSDNNYFNPHLLVNNPFKKEIRTKYLRDLFSRTTIYMVNTTGTPAETQKLIRSLANVSQAA